MDFEEMKQVSKILKQERVKIVEETVYVVRLSKPEYSALKEMLFIFMETRGV